MLRQYWDGVIELVFPTTCYACGQYEPLKNHLLCLNCQENLPWIRDSKTAKAALVGKDHFPSEVDQVNSLLFFTKSSKVQTLIQEIKYHGQQQLAIYLGEELSKRLKLQKHPDEYLLIPVPIHNRRLKQRGYNQALEIAKGLSKQLHIKIEPDVLKRIKFEGSQTSKNKFQRADILESAFIINDLKKVDTTKTVILIDDVITTGATIRSCVLLLLKAGFQNIHVASLAISI